ncbi:MAG: hypothetical protein H6742_05400 [Alphaproteobacteria bacterium]|nr:hypothetical protein [Alphaproteobacteria bacterium]
MRPVLVTAGATRNPVDAIRFLSAHSSGRTGGRLAGSLARSGLDVTMLASPEAWLRLQAEVPDQAAAVNVIEYASTYDLLERMRAWVVGHPDGVVVHAAAVGDYAIADRATTKLPSGAAELVLRLRPTPKILDRIREWSPDAFIVSFKAASPETDEAQLAEIARAQRERTDSDLVFANVIGNLQNLVLVVGREGLTRHGDRGAAMDDLVRRIQRVAGLPPAGD